MHKVLTNTKLDMQILTCLSDNFSTGFIQAILSKIRDSLTIFKNILTVYKDYTFMENTDLLV